MRKLTITHFHCSWNFSWNFVTFLALIRCVSLIEFSVQFSWNSSVLVCMMHSQSVHRDQLALLVVPSKTLLGHNFFPWFLRVPPQKQVDMLKHGMCKDFGSRIAQLSFGQLQCCVMQLNERSIHDSVANVPTHVTKSDFHALIFPVLSCLVSFHFLLDKTRQVIGSFNAVYVVMHRLRCW